MTDDEKAIRELLATWHRATAAGDVAAVLRLMADDVVFLTPGRPPIRGRAEFAALAAGNKLQIQSTFEVDEIVTHGDWASCICRLAVSMRPAEGGAESRRSGYTLSIFRKQADGRWVLARDANMLAPEP